MQSSASSFIFSSASIKKVSHHLALALTQALVDKKVLELDTLVAESLAAVAACSGIAGSSQCEAKPWDLLQHDAAVGYAQICRDAAGS